MSNIVSHVQRSQPQQKLGVLYAIDAVSRQWMEKAAATGQDPTSASSQEGTFAGGVRRIRDILPTIMTDIIQSAPEDHKVHDKQFFNRSCLPHVFSECLPLIIGQNQQADRDLGTRQHLSCEHAERLQSSGTSSIQTK